MPTPVTESSEGGQHVEWSETFHAFLFRARIYLKRFGWIIIFTLAAGALVQVWKTRDIPPVYQSTAEMMVGMQISSGMGATASVNEVTMNYFATQVHNLNLNPKLKKQAYDDAMKLMPAGTPNPSVDAHADYLPSTLILTLTAQGSNPEFTQLYLQALMEDFLAEKEKRRQQRLTDYGLSLKGVAAKYEADIHDLQAKRSEFVNKINIADLNGELDSASKRLHALVDTQMELEAQLGKLRSRKIDQNSDAATQPVLTTPLAIPPTQSATTTPGTLSPVAPADVMMSHMPYVPKPGEEIPLIETDTFSAYIEKGERVETIDQDLAHINLLPIEPKYQQAKDREVELRGEIAQLKNSGLSELHPKMIGLVANLSRVQSDLKVMRSQRVEKLEGLKAVIEVELLELLNQEKDLQAKILEYSKIKDELDKLTSSIDMNTQYYAKAIAGMTALPEASQLDQEMLTINVPASTAGLLAQNPGKQIIGGAVIGIAGGIIIVFLLGVLDGRVMSIEDLTQRFDEPMLGVIPMQKRVNGQVELLKNNDQRQQFAESCRNIRSSLLYMDRQGQRPRVIMLTSSMPSEGKSTLSANLSITLGFASSRTLLVDADMRRGQLHKRFGLKNDQGLAEHIQDGLSLDQVIQHTASENLDFISCGHYPMQPGELLMSERFRESIQTLRQRYDFVIFDSPPILLTDDAASFATRADAVVFVVRAGYTRLRQVRTSIESLNRRGVNVYGMVVNFIDHREPSYYSYRYYDYYSYRPNRPAT